jgi:polyphosphate kinase 2 (PPK2 family)
LVKYWFSVSDEEQERRFRARIDDRSRRWKLSAMDLESRSRWVEAHDPLDLAELDPDALLTPVSA